MSFTISKDSVWVKFTEKNSYMILNLEQYQFIWEMAHYGKYMELKELLMTFDRFESIESAKPHIIKVLKMIISDVQKSIERAEQLK